MSADDASEAALVALTRNASATLAADRVRVLAINLGWTVTPSEHRIQTQIDGQPEDWAEREERGSLRGGCYCLTTRPAWPTSSPSTRRM